jgi:putative membrane protein
VSEGAGPGRDGDGDGNRYRDRGRGRPRDPETAPEANDRTGRTDGAGADPDATDRGATDGGHPKTGDATATDDPALTPGAGPVGALPARLPRGRREWEGYLDALVRENRFTISVVFPLTGGLLLVASAEGVFEAVASWLTAALPPFVAGVVAPAVAAVSFHPLLILLGTIVMRSPLVVALLPLFDRRATLGVAALALYAYAIESVGLRTGWPYGEFTYVVDLGPTVAGVPVGLPVFFLPLVMNGYLLTLLVLGDRAARRAVRVPVVVAVVVVMDLVLDPGAVALTFWTYPGGGPVYGVPLSNFAGWVLSATVAVAVLDAVFAREALLARLERSPFALDDLVSFVILWGGVNAWAGNWGSVALAVLFGLALVRADRFDAGLLRVPRLSAR